jgi:PPM family protein phosphatase
VLGRASIVGAAETSVGKVREHNEDSHFIDPEAGIFIVCDGMGGHAAGEVASGIAVKTIRAQWTARATQTIADRWLDSGTPESRKALLHTVQQGVVAAHDAIVAEASADRGKHGMGTTVVAAIVVGGDVVFAHCGDSRAYLVRDGITVQLTEDHTLLARLLAAGVDVDTEGDGARFKSMLTNALGIGQDAKVSTFVVPVADGDRFLLCSDGITEYLQENEIGDVLTTMPSPARSAQRLVEIALQRGGGDNATALVVKVLEAGETARPADALRRDQAIVNTCPLWGRANPQQRLRAQRIALPRDHAANEKIPAQTLGDRVSWIVVEGEIEQGGLIFAPGALLYPEALLSDRPLPDKHQLAVSRTEIRALALRADDFKELCEDDPELAELLLEALAAEIGRRVDGRGGTAVTEPTIPPPLANPAPVSAFAPTIPPPKPDSAAKASDGSDQEADLAFSDTGQFPAVEPPPTGKPRQQRASTVPPGTVRSKSNTDKGLPAQERAPAESGPEAVTAGGKRLSRGSNPPTDKSRSLIVHPTDTAAAVDEALSGITGDATASALRGPQTGNVPPSKPASPATDALSEPEISIEELAEMVADESNDEPEIEVSSEEPSAIVAADANRSRAKRQTDAPD